jgi:NADH-quinone oxidoreductase subunit G
LSAAELVTLTIDDVEVSVPKGTGLVEAAALAGIEIPVFCYEPRLGPPVGACRMCLCEIAPGPPKPQAACTLTAADGMVVKTAQTSGLAADAQNATLEFILVNHPLDCPVCDKGGECPLQDLTFRYGPGSTRMTFDKRTFDKPIPISPTIALDRERCILCYRCTRFSEQVAEDGQLVARNRGAHSMIATFEDLPYRAPFSGNVIELCPVGALTSTLYRFESRPWEIQNVPTICGLCPVGCNVSATIREGHVRRVSSRNHPEVDQGWICDRGRFAYPALRAADRVTTPLVGVRGTRRFEEATWEDALHELERLGHAAAGAVVLALSGSETVEIAYALSHLVRAGLGSHHAVLPERGSASLDAYRAPLSSIGQAEIVVVIGDDPVSERAPVVDLWIRAARRHGADVITFGPVGSTPRPPGDGPAIVRELADRRTALGKRLVASDRVALVWSGPGGSGGEELASLAHALGFAGKPACGAFYLPATPTGRAVEAAWAAAGEDEPTALERIGLLIVSGEDAAVDPRVRELAGRSDAVVVVTMFAEDVRGWADVVLPGTSYLERNGTLVNLEGRPQRVRRAANPPGRDDLDWIGELAARFEVDIAVPPQLALAGSDERASLPQRGEERAPASASDAEAQKPAVAPKLRLARYTALFSGSDVTRVPQLAFQRPEPIIELSPEDASRRSIESGDTVTVLANGTSVELRARINARLISGAARAAEEHVRGLPDLIEVRP